jgi:hypothetical protein
MLPDSIGEDAPPADGFGMIPYTADGTKNIVCFVPAVLSESGAICSIYINGDGTGKRHWNIFAKELFDFRVEKRGKILDLVIIPVYNMCTELLGKTFEDC